MLDKKEREALAMFLDWYFKGVRSKEELEAVLLKFGLSKEYAKWRAST